MPGQIISYVGQEGYGRTFIQLEDPANDPSIELYPGDYWIEMPERAIWDKVKPYSWGTIKNYKWGIIDGLSVHRCWDGNEWVIAADNLATSDLYTQITQTKEEIRLEAVRANAAEGEIRASISIAADTILSSAQTYTDNKLTAYSTIEQTASAISTYVTSALGPYSTTAQTATAISTYVTSALGPYSTTEQTASAISTYVTNALGSYSTTSQTADAISAYVTNNAYTKQSGIKIEAAGIELTGAKYVKIISGASFVLESDNMYMNSTELTMGVRTVYTVSDFNNTYRLGWHSEHGGIFLDRELLSDGEWNKNMQFKITCALAQSTNFSHILDNNVLQIMAHSHADATSRLTLRHIYFVFPKQTGTSSASCISRWIKFGEMNERYKYDSSTDTLSIVTNSSEFSGTLGSPMCICPAERNYMLIIGSAQQPVFEVNAEKYYGKDIAIHSLSSKEYKKDITALDDMGDCIDKLTPVSFRYKKGRGDKLFYGLIYEDTVDVMPVICEDNGRTKSIVYGGLTPVLLKEIQSLRKRVKELEEKVA